MKVCLEKMELKTEKNDNFFRSRSSTFHQKDVFRKPIELFSHQKLKNPNESINVNKK